MDLDAEFRAHLPRLDEYPDAGTHENHPARLLIVINEVEQDDKLHHNVGYNLRIGESRQIERSSVWTQSIDVQFYDIR